MNKKSYLVSALCDIGSVKQTNQDNILIKIGEDTFGEFGMFVVADGMGGLAAGDVASQIITSELKKWWDERLQMILEEHSDDDVRISVIDQELRQIINHANKKILNYSLEIRNKVGTTLSVIFIFNNTYLIKHIGDSRIYKIILSKGQINQLTEDHTWVNLQVKQGKMRDQEAKTHPKSHMLLKCLGVKENIELMEVQGSISGEDTFLICSDGFHGFLDEKEIILTLSKHSKDEEAIQGGLNQLLDIIKERGANDNISVIIVCENQKEKQSKLASFIRNIIN